MRQKGQWRAVVLAALLPFPASAAAQDTIPLIDVTATGTVEREAEVAELSFAVETSAATAAEAARTNATTMDRLVAGLKALSHVSEVRTIGYSVRPRYDQRNRSDDPQPIGYTAHNTVLAVVDSVRLVGSVIDAGLAAGANRIAGLSFDVRDPDTAHRDALAKAVADARAQAQVLAAAAGGTLGPIRAISAGGDPRPMRAARAVALEAMAVTTPIESGTTSYSATVSVTFTLVFR